MQRPKPPQPVCETCNIPLTVKHLIVECTKFQSERNKWLRNKNLKQILGETGDFSEHNLRNFLMETDLWTKI